MAAPVAAPVAAAVGCEAGVPCGVPWQWRPGGPGVVPASGPRGGGAVAVVVRARGGRAGCPRWLVRLPPVGSAVRALVGAVVVHCGGALRWCTTRAPPGGVWVPAPVVRGCPGAGCPRPGRGAPPRPRAEEVAAAGSGGAGGAGRRTVLLGGRKFPVRPTLAAGSLSATGLLTLNRKKRTPPSGECAMVGVCAVLPVQLFFANTRKCCPFDPTVSYRRAFSGLCRWALPWPSHRTITDY